MSFTLDPASLRAVVSDGTLTRMVVPWSDAGVSVLRTLVGGVGTGAVKYISICDTVRNLLYNYM